VATSHLRVWLAQQASATSSQLQIFDNDALTGR